MLGRTVVGPIAAETQPAGVKARPSQAREAAALEAGSVAGRAFRGGPAGQAGPDGRARFVACALGFQRRRHRAGFGHRGAAGEIAADVERCPFLHEALSRQQRQAGAARLVGIEDRLDAVGQIVSRHLTLQRL